MNSNTQTKNLAKRYISYIFIGWTNATNSTNNEIKLFGPSFYWSRKDGQYSKKIQSGAQWLPTVSEKWICYIKDKGRLQWDIFQKFWPMIHRYFKMGNVSCHTISDISLFMCEIHVLALSMVHPHHIHFVLGIIGFNQLPNLVNNIKYLTGINPDIYEHNTMHWHFFFLHVVINIYHTAV